MTSSTLLHAPDAFVGNHVGISYLESGRLERAMKIDHEVVACALFRYALVIIHHPLVAMVHEIDFQSLHPHIGIMFNDIEVLLDGEPCEPKEHTYSPLAPIVDELLDVNLVAHLKRVAHVLAPAFVQKNVLDAVPGGKVDEILIRLIIDTYREIHVPYGPMVPPVPTHFAGLNP